jgi:patatin-like phospholipase/acyl hydrolase
LKVLGSQGESQDSAKVGRATSAAPTYFEPHRIDGEDGDYYSLADGGVFANNPAMCALAEALSEGNAPGDIVMLSIGTGEHTRPIPHKDSVGWGLAEWAVPIIGVMMDGVSDTVQYQVGQILKENAYLRIQGKLTDAMDDMDDTSQTNVRALRLFAEGLARDHAKELEDFAELLLPAEGT